MDDVNVTMIRHYLIFRLGNRIINIYYMSPSGDHIKSRTKVIEYLASNYGKDPIITYLLKHREIVITPMTNAVGFYENRREEKTVMLHGGKVKYRDPNRDFPYNNKMT